MTLAHAKRRAILRHIGHWGPSTIRQIAKVAPQKIKHTLDQAAAACCESKLITRAGYEDASVLYALTLDGVKWLDEDDARRAAKAAEKKAARRARYEADKAAKAAAPKPPPEAAPQAAE